MIGWVATIVVGFALGVTSYWHGQAGGVGTSGAVFEVALLLALVVFTAGGIAGGSR